MSVTEAQVLEALRPVRDPEINRSIVELDMVRGIAVAGSRVSVTVALTVAGCPMRTEITSRVTDAVRTLDGVDDVAVDLTVMTPGELDALRSKLQSSGGGHSHGGQPMAGGHGADVEIPMGQPGSKTRILGITSGKGGVGKSSVTVNLAIALAKQGYDVGLLDADVYGFSVPKMIGLGDAAPTVLDEGFILPPVAHGVKVISIGFFVEEDQPVMWRGPMLHKALQQFLTDFEWGDPDFLLVDMPPGTGDVALSMAQYLPKSEIFVVTTPQAAAQRVAQRTAYMAKKINQPLAAVIENMSWFTGDDGKRYEIFGSGGGEALAAELGVPLVGQVPLVPQLREGGDAGRPITVSHPDSEASQAFDHLAKRVVDLAPKRIYRPELRIS
ncbi:MAG: Mrp/NBP35 family ATP-binding protein [Acidimicrobiia bacterium]